MLRNLRRYSKLRSRHVRAISSDSEVARVVEDALTELYNIKSKRSPQQKQVVMAVTGGGGHTLAYLLGKPGATTTLLEAIVPYDKNACLDFLHRENRVAPLGFCSKNMAEELALAALSRAMFLQPQLQNWKKLIGVSSTATIVSHYTRRGGYRCHAAAVDAATGEISSYTHELVKGARDRKGEDIACSLLTLRALADAAKIPSASKFESLGVCTVPCPPGTSNDQGEEAGDQVEVIPTRRSSTTPLDKKAAKVIVGDHSFPAPAALPPGSIIFCLDEKTDPSEAAESLNTTRVILKREGERRIPPAPVFFVGEASKSKCLLENVANSAFLHLGEEARQDVGAAVGRYPRSTFLLNEEQEVTLQNLDIGLFQGAEFVYTCSERGIRMMKRLNGLDDGSPSTRGVPGLYEGGWKVVDGEGTPHHAGTMTWDNGITYEGTWREGRYDGTGSKMYSKGGGYKGNWVAGQREGEGVSIYDGKWGYDRWEGPFVSDKPHGKGKMFLEGEGVEDFEFTEGEPVRLASEGKED